MRLAHAQKPARIKLFEKKFVVAGFGAERVAEDLAGAVVGVHAHIMIAGRIRTPHDFTVSIDCRVGKIALAFKVAHADRVVLGALHIDAPRQQLVARRMGRCFKIEERFLVGELLAIEHHRFAPRVASLAADQRMLVALAVAAVIGERPVLRRRVGIVFLDACAHFLQQCAAQTGDGLQHRLGVVVLARQIGAHIARQRRGLAQHFLPVGGAQPGVVVDDSLAVKNALLALFEGGGGNLCRRNFGRC